MVTYRTEASTELLHQYTGSNTKASHPEIKCVLSRFVMARSFLHAPLCAGREDMTNEEITDLHTVSSGTTVK